ncbi:MAG: AraC family transcriptional regulator [Halioglobus sp.]
MNTALSTNANNAFLPLIEVLQDELHLVGVTPPSATNADTGEGFALWFVETIELLERHVADNDDHAPMTREEVELMCRCALSAADLNECFKLLKSFTGMLYPRAGSLSVSNRTNSLRVSIDTLRTQRTMASSLVDIAGLFAFKQLFHWLSGGRANVLQVGIGEMPRADVMPFLLLFNVPVLAEGESLYLDYELNAGATRITATAGDFDAFFCDFPCNLFTTEQSHLEKQVSALIAAAVRQALPIPSQSDIASTLKLPLSTFRRHLKAQGQSFRAIRDRCLQENAEQLLQQHELSITQIAERLGFRDGDTFRTAFRRWTGQAPQQWRRQSAHKA